MRALLERLAALTERRATNGDTGGDPATIAMPEGTRFVVGRKKRKTKKTLVPRAIETGNDPGKNLDFKAD